MTDWMKHVQANEAWQLEKLKQLLAIPSVLDPSTISEGAPFGQSIQDALDWFLQQGQADGFQTHNAEGYVGWIEWGDGPDETMLGVLGHLDVVPPGEGWTREPFQPVVENGKLYARGAIDDKGPTFAAYTAMVLLKQIGIKPNKKVRLILGTDEESSWKCMAYYKEHATMPAFGFTPDADFPVTFAEKGLMDLYITIPRTNEREFVIYGGDRLNMVAGKCSATVEQTQIPKSAGHLNGIEVN
ncbi:MAG: Sapep family Mn(2+)-dependent dipeptidase, partial [Bacilli bacterium]